MDPIDRLSRSGRLQSGDAIVETRCVYCAQRLSEQTKHEDLSGPSRNEFLNATGWRCPKCGWWLVKQRHYTDDDLGDNSIVDVNTFYEGAIARFDLAWGKVALADVEGELASYRKTLSTLPPRDLEALIARAA